LIATAVLITALLLLGISRRDTQKSGTTRKTRDSRNAETLRDADLASKHQVSSEVFHRCPLCGSLLTKKEKVKSVLYPGKPDGMMEIYGCPYCYGPGSKKERTCPVCKKALPREGLVYARFFQTAGRKHAHVLGCTNCYTRHRQN
jgi:hypothetical protein